MIIGIDASRAFVDDRTGTENYSYHVITQILQLPEAKKHVFVLFIRLNAKVPREIGGYDNVIVKNIKFKYLWTQLGLAWETWKNQVFQYSGKPVIQQKTGVQEDRRTGGLKLDVLWIPAHTLPVLRKPGIQTVVTIHGLEYQWLPEYKNFLQKWYLPLSTYYAAKAASGIIAVSTFTAKQLQKETLIDKKSIKVIHEGVELIKPIDHSNIKPMMEKFGIEDKKYILFVGSVQPRKNLVALLEAFSQLRLQLRGDTSQIKLVIAGGIGWMADDILQAPAKFGVQEKVIFTGRISDLELDDLYSHAQMYVQPSITEGFGLPVLEAMGHGGPVISSDGGALSEVVGSAGIIVSLKNDFVNELTKSMAKLCENSEKRAKLVVAGKKRVSELTWSKTAKETLKYLIDIGSKKVVDHS
jgi:glycosyltransferase involved in cell wall biosynthesis